MHKVRLAQIGVGYWGKNLLRNFTALPTCQVIAVCDADPTAQEFIKDRYPSLFVYKEIEDVFFSR